MFRKIIIFVSAGYPLGSWIFPMLQLNGTQIMWRRRRRRIMWPGGFFQLNAYDSEIQIVNCWSAAKKYDILFDMFQSIEDRPNKKKDTEFTFTHRQNLEWPAAAQCVLWKSCIKINCCSSKTARDIAYLRIKLILFLFRNVFFLFFVFVIPKYSI